MKYNFNIWCDFAYKLWFDVEKKGNTTILAQVLLSPELWFDVEKKGNTTPQGVNRWDK